MRAKSFLCEVDNRTLVKKLKDLIDHPSTLDPVREIAKTKLRNLLNEPILSPIVQPQVRLTSVNLDERDLDRVFSFYKGNVTCRQIYDSLRSLKPTPSDVVFLRQGQIHLFVPPPFLGLTKHEYTKLLCNVLPGIRNLSSKFVQEKGGYHFIVTL